VAVVAAMMPLLVASTMAIRRILVIMSVSVPIFEFGCLAVASSKLGLAVVAAQRLCGCCGGRDDAGAGGQQQGDTADFGDHVGVPPRVWARSAIVELFCL
jgi:hypothetical protein